MNNITWIVEKNVFDNESKIIEILNKKKIKNVFLNRFEIQAQYNFNEVERNRNDIFFLWLNIYNTVDYITYLLAIFL